MAVKSYKDMHLQTPKQTITETDTRPLKTHKHKTLRGRNSLPVVGPVSRDKDKDKDKDMNTFSLFVCNNGVITLDLKLKSLANKML